MFKMDYKWKNLWSLLYVETSSRIRPMNFLFVKPCEQCVDCDLWDMEKNCGCPCHRQETKLEKKKCSYIPNRNGDGDVQ